MKNYPINYEDFKIKYGTEKQCIDYLYELRWQNLFCCPRCKSHDMWKINERKYKCRECSYQTTIISGTYLQGTHLPLTTWFEAVWHIVNQRGESNALELQQLLHLGNNRTALNLLEKIRTIMKYCDRDKLHGEVYVDDFFYHNKRYSSNSNALIGVEIIDEKVSRIRIDSWKPRQIDNFVKKYIESGSTIHIKINGTYQTVPKEYTLIREPQISTSRRHPKLIGLYKELKVRNLYASTSRQSEYVSKPLCISECCYKFNRRDTPIGEMFYEILYNAMHINA